MNRTSSRPYALVVLALALAWLSPAPTMAQSMEGHTTAVAGHGSANYDLAARWAPYKMREMVHSTTVSPRWIEGAEKFWYEWETSEGKTFYIVDAARGTKRPVFDNDRMAAELTRITLDPYDGQHLPITRIRFIDENTIQFDVTSSQDEEAEEDEVVQDEDVEEQDQEEEQSSKPKKPKKKVHHFEFNVGTQTLRELEDYEAPDNHPSWASVSPDGETVLFAKEYNLWMMSGDDYQKILDARRGLSGDEADSAEVKIDDLEEIQLSEDGERYYSYEANNTGRGETNVSREEKMEDRKRVSVSWSSPLSVSSVSGRPLGMASSLRFSMIHSEARETI